MTPALLPRSRKPVSLFISIAGALLALGLTASPAMALSLNPDAASPGINEANTLHSIVFVLIIAVIVVVNLAILNAARPRTRHVKPGSKQKSVPTNVAIGAGIFSFILFFAAIAVGSLAAILIALVVIAALNLALLKAAGPRAGGSRSGKVSQVSIAATLGVLALTFFAIATIFSDRSREIPVSTETVAEQVEGKPLEIRATAQQWLWRFDYPNGAFSYRRLVVPAGVTVKLDLVSTDVIHGWNVPELTGKAQAIPGKTNPVYFRADDPGTYHSHSSVFSGQGYDTMEIEVEVVAPDDYEAAIETLKEDIQTAQDKVEAEFQASREKSDTAAEQAEKAETQDNQDEIESAETE